MAFHGCEFSFAGIPSFEYGLVIYNLNSYKQDDTFSYPSVGEIVEERLDGRTTPLFYGLKQNKPMEFRLVFGIIPGFHVPQSPLDRWDLELIASWLTDRNGYQWLEIDQNDMEDFRLKCIISDLEVISYDLNQWAYQCKVTCDSPYAYTYPQTFTYHLSGNQVDITFKNRSSSNRLYYPKLILEMNGGTEISIVNHDLKDEVFQLTDLPVSTYKIKIDNENQILTSDLDINLYEHFSCTFLRFIRGDNHLTLSGNGTIKIICEFPVNIGG